MKIVFVSVSMAELKAVAEPLGDALAKGIVEALFEPMIVKGSCKRVKK